MMVRRRPGRGLLLAATVILALVGARALTVPTPARAQNAYLFNDSHFHLTNYIQEGTDIHKYLGMMGTTVGRSTLFGIPLATLIAPAGDDVPEELLEAVQNTQARAVGKSVVIDVALPSPMVREALRDAGEQRAGKQREAKPRKGIR